MSEIKLVEINDASLDTDNDDARLVKVQVVGPDVQTPTQLAPYGVDSNPIKGVIGAMSDTLMNGEPVLVGVVNTENKAEKGEVRFFATDEEGNVLFELWMKGDGTLYMNGDADNAVRYSKLEEAYNQLKSDHDDVVQDNNNLKTAFASFQSALTTAGGTPLTGTSLAGIVATAFATYYGQPLMPSTGDITPAKIDEITTT